MLEFADHFIEQAKEANSLEEIKAEIEADLNNLVYLFKDTVIEAIALELPFIGAITHVNEVLKAEIQSSAYRKFLENNIRDIYYQAFINLDDQATRKEIKLKIVTEMNSIITRLERGG